MNSETAHFFLRDLALILGTAAIGTVVFQRLRLPLILGYLVAGMLVGPLTPWPLIHDPETIRTLAELGVALLMFTIGLEFRIRRLVTLGPRVALAVLVEVGLMLLLGYGAARALGWGERPSLLTAGVVAISSTMVVSRTMSDLHADRRLKEIVFGVLVMEDIAAILLVAVLTTVSQGSALTGSIVAGSVGRLGLVLVALLAGGMLIVPRAIRAVVALRRPETLVVAAIAVCLGLSALSIAAGYSVALGAFIAGALVAESGAHHLVGERIRPVRDLFVAVFFVAVGMLFEPAAIAGEWGTGLLLFAVVVIGKVVGVTSGVFLAGYGTRDAIRAGLSLAQIGEFSFVIAGLGAAQVAGSGALYAAAVVVATATAFTTPLLSRRADRVAAWVDRRMPHPVQTTAALYASWVELLLARKGAARGTAQRRLGWLLALDAAFLAGAIIATSVVYRRLPAWLGLEESAARLAGLRLLLLAGGAAIALPFGIGLLRTIRRLALGMAESAIPKPGKGVDQGLAPRRTLIATLEIGLVVAVGVPLTLVTLPFVPPFGVAGVILAYLLILGIAFWRNASDLDRHARAGSELIVHVLAKQAHPDAGSFEVVRGLLPGLGMIVPLEVRPGSEADGLTLGDLNLRGRTGASVVGVSRDGQRTAEATAATRLQAGDMLAITGSENAIDLAAALMRARGTSSPPSATGASAPPVE